MVDQKLIKEIDVLFQDLEDIKEDIKKALMEKFPKASLDNLTFLEYHKVLMGDGFDISVPKVNNAYEVQDMEAYFFAMTTEKACLKEALIEKGINMDGVPFTKYYAKILEIKDTQRPVKIYVYNTKDNKNSLYPNHRLYFLLKDLSGNILNPNPLGVITVSGSKNDFPAPTIDSKTGLCYVTLPNSFVAQNITIKFESKDEEYSSATRTITTSIPAFKTTGQYSVTGLRNSDECPESEGGTYTYWRTWEFNRNDNDELYRAVCGGDINSRMLAGKNGTNKRPAYLECYFEDMEQFCLKNVLKIKSINLTFVDALFPPKASSAISGCPSLDPVGVKLQLNNKKKDTKESTKSPTRNGSGSSKYQNQTFTWDGLNNNGSDFISTPTEKIWPILLIYPKNETTNTGRLVVKNLRIKISYIPKQESVTITDEFN